MGQKGSFGGVEPGDLPVWDQERMGKAGRGGIFKGAGEGLGGGLCEK